MTTVSEPFLQSAADAPPGAPGALPPDRRRWPRLTAVLSRARVAWRTRGVRVSKAPARLLDISEGGARLVTDAPAPPGQTVWLGLEDLPCEWVKATVRESVPAGLRWVCRLRFEEPCPPGLIERAVTRKAEPAPAWGDLLVWWMR